MRRAYETTATPLATESGTLNIAEIELSALSRQCLDRRMPNQAFLESEVKAWEDERNDQIVKVQWLLDQAHV
jgi:hypothetical protein